jgi:hypothetical protein
MTESSSRVGRGGIAAVPGRQTWVAPLAVRSHIHVPESWFTQALRSPVGASLASYSHPPVDLA